MPDFDRAASLLATQRQDAEGCCKVTEDLARYRRVIASYHPDVVVETGTFAGMSAAWFGRIGDCPVVTVDVGDRIDRATWGSTSGHERVVLIVGDSANASTVTEVFDWVAGYSRPLVVLDSDHTAVHVRAEIDAYSPLVPPGGWMVVEDGIARWMPDFAGPGSPLDAIEAWLPLNDGWVVDREVCDLSAVTMHPEGWLRRLR